MVILFHLTLQSNYSIPLKLNSHQLFVDPVGFWMWCHLPHLTGFQIKLPSRIKHSPTLRVSIPTQPHELVIHVELDGAVVQFSWEVLTSSIGFRALPIRAM